jgi:sarcosine oxidase subunit delta
MLLIPCPHCGPRAQVEFVFDRPAEAVVPLDATTDALVAGLFTRTNARDWQVELWRHAHGCRAWLRIERHVVTHDVRSVTLWPG